MRYQLRPYQVEIGRAVLDSVVHRKGLSFTVELARQGGKNELSAQLGVLLLTLFMVYGGNMVKCAPTFTPQALISLERLQERLREAGYDGLWKAEAGYTVRVGRARQIFFSADRSASVVGATAQILLEVDEAQDVEKEVFWKRFRPMGASTNVTTVLYGTPWDDSTLLEEVKQVNLEQERKDGIKRHFHFDWQAVARFNPLYKRYVEQERERLGEEHPLFRSQYLLETVKAAGGLLSAGQRAQLQGRDPRQRGPTPHRVYVAAIDLAGGLSGENARRDSTVVTVGELDFANAEHLFHEPRIQVVEHYWWTGRAHADLYPQLVDLLKGVWQCRKAVVDATGMGEGMASFLERALGKGVVEPFTFTSASKSRLGFELLAAVNGGRLKMYAPDGSPECQEFWRQISQADAHYRPNRTMEFGVVPERGHDDFLMSLALLVRAGAYLPRTARGYVREA